MFKLCCYLALPRTRSYSAHSTKGEARTVRACRSMLQGPAKIRPRPAIALLATSRQGQLSALSVAAEAVPGPSLRETVCARASGWWAVHPSFTRETMSVDASYGWFRAVLRPLMQWWLHLGCGLHSTLAHPQTTCSRQRVARSKLE